MKRIVWIVNLLLASWLTGCGWMDGPQTEPPPDHRHTALPGRVSLADPEATRAALLEQYLDWAGVPYRIGGSSREGLDCSGFIQLTYLQRFGVELPRHTAAQRSMGSEVEPSRLRPGDLVFFDTGPAERHVGIYVGKRQFLHVSSSAGVMLSRLDDGYWEPRFRDAVRVDAR
jgi:cell wall-associated NlpC family hydrolase